MEDNFTVAASARGDIHSSWLVVGQTITRTKEKPTPVHTAPWARPARRSRDLKCPRVTCVSWLGLSLTNHNQQQQQSMKRPTNASRQEEDKKNNKGANIEELRSQKRKQEGEYQDRLRTANHGLVRSNSERDANDPALQRFLQLAKQESQHKRDKLKAIKEGTATTTELSSEHVSSSGFARKNKSYKQQQHQLSVSDHPRSSLSSQKMSSLHNLFEWDQIHHTRTTLKKRPPSRRKFMSNKSERPRAKPDLDSLTNNEEVSKSSSYQRESRIISVLHKAASDRRIHNHIRSSNPGLADYLVRDRARGKHGSMQDFIERSVASDYSNYKEKPKKKSGKPDLLQDFTAKYQRLQREQLQKVNSNSNNPTTTSLERKIYTPA